MKPLLASLLVTLLSLPALPAAEEPPGLLRVNTTIQTYNPSQPWELNTPRKRRGLGAVVSGKQVLTTAEI